MGSSAEIDLSIAESARRLAPVVWLIGKVQSGKTTIIRELAQADEATLGSGFRACTKSARVFDFPSEAPIIRFLDTRGLGEVAYDPRAGGANIPETPESWLLETESGDVTISILAGDDDLWWLAERPGGEFVVVPNSVAPAPVSS